MLNLFHTPMFEESLRGAEGLLRKREMASEGRERGSQSQREERTTKKDCVTERGGECQQVLLRFLGSEKRHQGLGLVCPFPFHPHQRQISGVPYVTGF